MSQSLSAVYVHVVFSTKDRRPFFRDLEVRGSLHAYLGSVSGELGCNPLITGGVEDHIHMLARLGREMTQAGWVKELKRISSIWVKRVGSDYATFEWQSGYGAFSVSQSNVGAVCQYIANQIEHHRTMSFKEEFLVLLKRHELPFDERYLWD
ncbi:MAG: transposase [Verrucomicrobia bacterium]|nr:transposase [Verrucomicrobiota bacterium]